MKTDKKTLIITGSSGLLGNELVRSAPEDTITIPVHHTRQLHKNSIGVDIGNRKMVDQLLSNLQCKVVIHTASETNVDKCETEKELARRTNIEGTKNVALACAETNSKLIYVSSDYVFNGEKGFYHEEDEPDPVNYYGITKLEGEKLVREICENHAILRTSVLYGWHPWKQNFATWAIHALQQGRKVTVVDDHFNTPTFVGSMTDMTLEAVDSDLRGTYHFSGRERVSRYDFAKQLAQTFDLDERLITPVRMSQLTAWVAKRPRDSSLATEKAQKELKTKPLDIREGLNKMKSEQP